VADPGRRSRPPRPDWDLRDAKDAVMRAAEKCADLTSGELRILSARLRGLVFDDAVVEAERARAADEALAAAGLVPPPRGRHLHVAP
jgi:hypothetical protein